MYKNILWLVWDLLIAAKQFEFAMKYRIYIINNRFFTEEEAENYKKLKEFLCVRN